MKVYINYAYTETAMTAWISEYPGNKERDCYPYYHAFEVNVPDYIDIEEAIECDDIMEGGLENTDFGQYLKRIGFDISKQYLVDEDEIALAVNKYAQSKFANLPDIIKVVIDE